MMCGSLVAQDNQKLSDTEKMIYFEKDKKSALTAVSLEIIIPYTGYNYLNNINLKNVALSSIRWTSGVYAIAFIADNNIDDFTSIFTSAIYTILTYIQMHDLINKTEKYNNNLYRQIFDKEPPSFSLNLQPTYQGANLTLSYAFN